MTPTTEPAASGMAWGLRPASKAPAMTISGRIISRKLVPASTVRPSASPPRLASVSRRRAENESTTRHRPPNSSACARVSAKADRLV